MAGYANGKEFVEDLYRNYGLLEGCEMAEKYLFISEYSLKNNSPEEKQFCKEVREALNKLNRI